MPIGSCPRCGKELVIRNSKTGNKFVGCVGFPACGFTADAIRHRTAEDRQTGGLVMDEMTTPLFNFSKALEEESRRLGGSHTPLIHAAHVIRILATYLREWRKLEDPSTTDAIDRAVQQIPKELR